MPLERARHQKSEVAGRANRGDGEANPEMARDEARLACHTKESSGQDSLLHKAVSRENIYHASVTSTFRTAQCGPACRVVWEGHT